MRLTDYFADEPDPPDPMTDEEMSAYLNRYALKLNAFLQEAQHDPETDPEELTQANQMLDELLGHQADWEQICALVAASEREIDAAHATIRATLDSLPDDRLRLLMQATEARYGWTSPEYQKLLLTLGHYAPERLAPAIDT